MRRRCKISSSSERALLPSLESLNPDDAAFRVTSTREGKQTYFHTTTFSAGTYFAFPFATLQSTVVVFRGVGIRRTTPVAESFVLKLAFTVTAYDT
jgi:hypothetical protein